MHVAVGVALTLMAGLFLLWLVAAIESAAAYTRKVQESRFHRHTEGPSVAQVLREVARRDAAEAARRARLDETEEIPAVRPGLALAA